jgi:hypothetical protein
MTERYWAVAQTVPKMEHIARREIEKTNHGAFLPTCVRSWKVDGRDHVKESPLFTGYVFFLTDGDDWAGIPDILGVYSVPANPNHRAQRVRESDMFRLVVGHAVGDHNRTEPPRYTKYFRGEMPRPPHRRSSRKPRPGKRLRNLASA